MRSELFETLKIEINCFSDHEKAQLRSALEKHLEEMAYYLDLLGENPHRVRAYRKVKAILYRYEAELPQLIRTQTLQSLDGIGSSIEAEILDFCQNCGQSTHLESIKLELPPFLIELSNENHLRRGLLKIFRAYPLKSEDELRVILDTSIAGTLIPITREQITSLKEALRIHSIETDLPDDGKLCLKGAAFHIQDSSQILQEGEEPLLSLLDFILYPDGKLKSHGEQVHIRHSFQLSRPSLCLDFFHEVLNSSTPLVDFLRFPGLFAEEAILKEDFLRGCEQDQKLFLIPLHPILREPITALLRQIFDYQIPILFSAALPGIRRGLIGEILYLGTKTELKKERILNFQPAEVLMRSLLR